MSTGENKAPRFTLAPPKPFEVETRSRYFFIRRIPHSDMPRDWPQPESEERYQAQLDREGFVSDRSFEGGIPASLKIDLRELEEHLMPHFWRINHRARFYQNRFYQYQWAFIVAAFLTTILAAVNASSYAIWDKDGPWLLTDVLGFMTALVSGVAATVSYLDSNERPQQRWFEARVQAEGLRSAYFMFLTRQKPFDMRDDRERVHRLRNRVLDILQEKPPERTEP